MQRRLISQHTKQAVVQGLVEKHGAKVAARATEGVRQVAEVWREEDGDDAAFQAFVHQRFVANSDIRTALLARIEESQQQVNGHLSEIRRALRRFQDVESFEDPGLDDLLAQFSPAPDLAEEWYRSRLAFVILLNFPRTDIAHKLREGREWTLDAWREARVADRVPRRLPRGLDDLARAAHQRSDVFIQGFHIPVGCVVDGEGNHPFPPDRKLLAHWLVRDELRGLYGNEDGLPRQRLLARIMGRHIDGTIPKMVMDGSAACWCPVANSVDGDDHPAAVGLERYAVWLDLFHLAQTIDPHYPDYPRHIERSLELGNELPVAEVESLLRELLGSAARGDVMASVADRLGRPLEPFDIYFNDLTPRESAEGYDQAVFQRLPDFDAFQHQLPSILQELGFAPDTAAFLADRIQVDAARGCGHASPAALPEYRSFLRTNRVNGRMNWPGLGCSMHELGHCVEQVFSLHRAPALPLQGVPCLAVTEAMAFTFQGYAHQIAGLPQPPLHREHTTLATFLNACEIAGPSLVDLLTWRWLYDHPETDVAGLAKANLQIADEIWNTYYADLFGPDENHLLAAYQHMIGMMLYLPNYTVGHVIAHQVSRQLATGDFAAEVERMCSLGRLTPDQWLREAVGEGLSAARLIEDAAHALAAVTNDGEDVQ